MQMKSRLMKAVPELIKLKTIDGTEINGMGPVIKQENIDQFFKKLDSLQRGDTLVLAGSIPSTMPETMYSDIMHRLEGRGIRIVVDATKDLLECTSVQAIPD